MGPDPGTGFWSGRNFWLDFDCDLCSEFLSEFLFAPSSDSSILGVTSGSAYIYMDDPEHPGVPFNKSNAGLITFGTECAVDASGAPINCVVGATPEPGVLSLVLGALGGGWLARRRKSRAKSG
jgi:hypothetical protein